MSFASKAIAFYQHLDLAPVPVDGVRILNPYAEAETQRVVECFYERFYNDDNTRVGVFGINPGRFGGGLTGISFTDPVALQSICSITTSLTQRAELSSTFVYRCIDAYGGVQKFFSSFYLTALCPLGFTRNDKNYNFYDDPECLQHCEDFIVNAVRSQCNFPLRRDRAICLGRGSLFKIFDRLNKRYDFFDEIVPLDHPRFIMQYRRSQLDAFVDQYCSIFNRSASLPAVT